MEFLRQQMSLRELGRAYVVATLIEIQGSAPQELGAKIIVTQDGWHWGTIGGGKVEAAVIQKAREVLSSQDSSVCQLVDWNLQTDIGMTCGGRVKILFEKCFATFDWKIVIFGAGHVAQALVRTLLPLNCSICCIDSRQEWLDRMPQVSKQAFKLSTLLVPEDKMAEQVAHLSSDHFIVIMTKGHATDLPILAAALSKEFPYIGNMGSLQKAKILKRDLKTLGIPEEKTNEFYCPIGEDFGNNEPEEIALSVVAQMIRVRDEKKLQLK